MKSEGLFKVIIIGLIIIVMALSSYIFTGHGSNPISIKIKNTHTIKKFKNNSEFKSYLAQSNSRGYYGFDAMERSSGVTGLPSFSAKDNATSQRHSDTNTQVADIDEPDIVKNDGKNIFYSNSGSYGGGVVFDSRSSYIDPENYVSSGTKTIAAFPLNTMKLASTININGDLLLDNTTLMILASNKITAYDVTNPSKPDQKWAYDFNNDSKSNTYYQDARFYNHKLYLITRTYVSNNSPCPVKLASNNNSMSIACTDIYYPDADTNANSTYTASIINPNTGAKESSVSFLGNYSTSTIYMSPQNLYLTYESAPDAFTTLANFVKENKDEFPDSIIDVTTKLEGYDISNSSKYSELSQALENYVSQSNDPTTTEKKYENLLKAYYSKHMRELSTTGIIQIPLNDFKIANTGTIPGNLLNQFSLDEKDGNLRVATTVGQTSFGIDTAGPATSYSDIYILDKDMKTIGTLQNLGRNERIYSTRFVDNLAYIVTFRQTDPFYIADLSNPSRPVLKGELKIPGYSSYLHPISKNLVLGVGQENFKLKLSLFDVTDPNNPVQKSKLILGDNWSEALVNHHAFLIDQDNKYFFIPTTGNSYVISFANGKLSIAKNLTEPSVNRALYIDDYLYTISNAAINIFNVNTWVKLKTFKF